MNASPPGARQHAIGRRRLGQADAAWALALALCIAAAWCVAYGRTSLESWRTPIDYRGDALFLSAYLRAASDGHVFPGASLTVPELNAPFEANWNDHPRTLRAVFAVAGLVARPLGLFATMNLLLLAAHVLSAVSLYLAARALGARREWAAACGFAYGLSHYLFWRSLAHLDLALAWHVPACILVVTWAFSRRGLPLRSRRMAVAALVTAVTALHNPYYSALYAQFLLLAGLAQLLRRGRRRLALAAALLAALLVAVFLLDNAGALAYQLRHGANAGAARPYGNLERFALKPIELLLPPAGHGVGNWGRVALVHWLRSIYKGEGESVYLGLVGAGTLLWLAWRTLASALRRPAQPPPATAWAVAWVLAYSMLGGINQLAGIAGFVWLRGTNRFSVWILALVLLYLATRRVRWPRASIPLAVGLAVLAWLDQVPRRPPGEPVAQAADAIAADRRLVRQVEAALPPGAMLFMLPVTEFPEGRRLLAFQEYEHLRPYLHARSLRFSFGTDKGRPRERWQAEVEALPPVLMAEALEACGFDGILLNRRAYEDEARALLDLLAQSHRPVTVRSAAGDYVLVQLHPDSRAATACRAAAVSGGR